tara:strand:+ start:202 stop:432 length:231 start_codon:yes stop_codon:yes gene_type:complete
MSSRPLEHHPDCKKKDSTVTRLISGGTGLIFKGSGFYLTDYTDKGKNNNSEDHKKPKTKAEKKPKSKKTKKESSGK